jgi:antitoxin component HigA of HigAB toxin-antitoxin module
MQAVRYHWPGARSLRAQKPGRGGGEGDEFQGYARNQTPGRTLAHLLEVRGLKPGDPAAVLPKSRVSEILAGKRAVSKD